MSDEEEDRKAAIAAERAKVTVTSVKIEPEAEEEELKADEQKEEASEEEAKEEDVKEEGEDKEDDAAEEKDKKELRAQRQKERTTEKFKKKDEEAKALKRRVAELEAKLAADPEQKLTEEDVETRAEAKANRKQIEKELVATSNKLAEDAQKQLKLKDKEFGTLITETLEELRIEYFPGEVVGALGDLDNGGTVLAHLLKNIDEMEDIFQLKNRPVKLGMELTKLSNKLSTPKVKKISQVPDPIEPLGGKPNTADRLNFLNNKKNKSQEEMDEWVQARNAQVAQARANGKRNLR